MERRETRVFSPYLACVAISLASTTASAEVIYDELRSGEMPSLSYSFVLRPGANEVRGFERYSVTFNALGERVLALGETDFFRVRIPSGYRITAANYSWWNGRGLNGVELWGGATACQIRSNDFEQVIAEEEFEDAYRFCANVVSQPTGSVNLTITQPPIAAGTYVVAAGIAFAYPLWARVNRELGIYYDYRWTLNVESVTGRNPRNYGLFVGVAADGANDDDADLRGDLAAARLAAAFGREPYSTAYTLTADMRRGAGISVREFTERLQYILSRARSGDNVFIYFTGHGGGLLGIGDEDTDLGFRLTDDGLTRLLQGAPAGVNKWVFVDSCHGGGFWGPGDPVETSYPLDLDDGDLNRVSRSALLSSSSEAGLAYYGTDGIPLISSALIRGWTRTATGYLGADVNRDGVLTMSDMAAYVREFARTFPGGYPGQVVYEMELGTPVAVSPDLMSPEYFVTEDFDGETVVGTVFGVTDEVEPASLLDEMAAAVVGLGPGTSLADKVAGAQGYFAVSDIKATCGVLSAFVNELWAQSGAQVDADLAGELIESAQTIRNAIGCR